MSASVPDPTSTLSEHLGGDPSAASKLLPLVYDELRALANHHMRGEGAAHTLQATALVHEVYMRLIDHERMTWQGRTHFLAMAATTLRRVLIDHARSKRRQKRGGDRQRVPITQIDEPGDNSDADPFEVSEALDKLASVSERQARVVELRFFAGLSVQEVASIIGVSPDTVKLDWRIARAWLNRELRSQLGDSADE